MLMCHIRANSMENVGLPQILLAVFSWTLEMSQCNSNKLSFQQFTCLSSLSVHRGRTYYLNLSRLQEVSAKECDI